MNDSYDVKGIFAYYGGRTHQISKILNLMRLHINEFETVVDVFGGSGKVLLSIPSKWRKNKVYNDIDKKLYITFKVLQDDKKREILKKKLQYAFKHQQIFDELKDALNSDSIDNNIDIAFATIYVFHYSYAGAGTSFVKEYSYKFKHINIDNLNFSEEMKDWYIFNKDFRELCKLYNNKNVLLYLDPPYYSGGKTYKYSFGIQDYKDLKEIINNHKGTYIMNISVEPEIIDIFGEPNFKEIYHRPTTKGTENENNYIMGWWVKFRKEVKNLNLERWVIENE